MYLFIFIKFVTFHPSRHWHASIPQIHLWDTALRNKKCGDELYSNFVWQFVPLTGVQKCSQRCSCGFRPSWTRCFAGLNDSDSSRKHVTLTFKGQNFEDLCVLYMKILLCLGRSEFNYQFTRGSIAE